MINIKKYLKDGQHNGQTKKDENKTSNGWQTNAQNI
jgi:hypothetical protein